MLKHINIIGITVFLMLGLFSLGFSEETLTITTYYPSPYGSYRELTSYRMKIGTNYSGSGTTVGDNNLIVEGTAGIGTPIPTYQLQLSTDSAAKPTTNTWTIASDRRIKKNTADFTDGLDIIMRLKPRTYQYNGLGGQGYDDTNTHIGFIAQEVEPIAPYMIETGKGTIGGAQVGDFKNYQGHALPFILVNAIQEQQKEIEELKREIRALKKVK